MPVAPSARGGPGAGPGRRSDVGSGRRIRTRHTPVGSL